MAARYSMSSGKVSTGALTTGSVKSMILLNPVTRGGSIIEAWISFGSTSAQSDIAVDLYRVVTVGTPAGTTGTVVKDNPNFASSTWTGLTAVTTEPTSVEVLRSGYVTTQNGLLVVYFPLGREPMAAPAGSRMGIRVVNDEAGTITAINCRATMVWEEE